MKNEFFQTKIEFLKGVGPQRAEILKKDLGIFTFEDLIYHFPYRYVDRTKFYKCNEASPDLPFIQVKGQLKSLITKGERHKKYLVGRFADETGAIELKWFKGLRFLSTSFKLNTDYILFGKPNEFNGAINIIHPELELISEQNPALATSLQPLYNTSEKMKGRGLDSRSLNRLLKALLIQLPASLPETLSKEIIRENKLMGLKEALTQIHFPETTESQIKASFRIKFEELFYIQLKLLFLKLIRTDKYKGILFDHIGDYFNTFYNEHLPFKLTNAQKRVIREIREDCGSGKQMNRLLQVAIVQKRDACCRIDIEWNL